MWSSLRTFLQSVSPDDKGALNCLRELEGSDPEREVEDLRRQLLEAGMGDAAIDRFLDHLEAFRRGESAAPLASYAGRNETQARSVLRTLGQRHRAVFDAVSDRWPSPLAHEIRRLQEELAEGTVITVQWQLTDCYELIMKFVCLALASDLLQVGDDILSRDVRRGLLRSLSGGAWLGLWRDLCKRAGAHRDKLKLPELIDEGRIWVGEGKGKFCNAFALLIAHRNNTKGHGALGYDQLEQVQGFIGLVDALAKCARDGLHHFDDLMLFGEELERPWAGWQTIRTRHDADCRNHTEHIAPLYLRRGDGEGAMDLALSPLIAQRQCAHCGRRDVFMFDSFDSRGERARFYLNDYLAGHRMSPEVSDVPDFHPLLNGLDLADLSDTEAPTDEAISSDFLQWLEDSLEEARYLAPEYLFDPVREYLQTHDRGVALLTAPAMVGKSVFSAHLERALRDKPPEHARAGRWVVKHFAIRRGLTGLSLDQFDNYLDHEVLRTPRSEGGLGIQPANNPTSLSTLHALMREGGANVSWPQVFAQRLRELMARVRNETVSVVLVIDGLDELPAESAERGLGACLDAPALSEALPEGCYLVLTARPADECGAMSGVVKRLQAQAAAAGLHLQVEPQQIIESASQAAPLSRAYRALLEKMYDKRIASKRVGVGLDHTTLLPILLERSLGRFGYMEHIARLFEEGIVQAEDVAGLPKGERLYSHYLEELRRQLDPDLDAKGAPRSPGRAHTRNRWQELVGVLCLLAAEERAFNAELKEIGTFYPGLRFEGLSLDLLARALNLPRPTYALIKQLVQIRPLLTTHRMGHETYSNVGIGTRDLLETLLQGKAYAEGLREAHQNLYSLHWAETQRQPGIEANDPITEERLPSVCRASWHRSMTGTLSPADAERDALVRDLFAAGSELREAVRSAGSVRAFTAVMAQVRPLTSTDVWRDEEGGQHVPFACYEQAGLGRTTQLQKLSLHAAAIRGLDGLTAHWTTLIESLGEDCPTKWRNDLAGAYSNRGLAKEAAPGYGPVQALADYERAVAIGESLVTALGENCPPEWRHDLAGAYLNRGNYKSVAPGSGPVQALADYERAVVILESLVTALGEDCPPQWRNDLAKAYMNRGVAKQAAPGYGPVQALADYDRAVGTLESLVAALGEGCPPEWRNDLATAYSNRGNLKEAAPWHGPVQALADYERAVGIRESMVTALGEGCPPEWRDGLATTYANRGNYKSVAPGSGPVQALADYERAVVILESLVTALGEDCPPQWRNDLAKAYMNRGVAKQAAPGYGPVQALADYDRAVGIGESLVAALGEDCPPQWRDSLAKAYANRGNAKLAAPGFGPVEALADYERAVGIRESMVTALGEGCPPEWRDGLATTYANRGNAKLAAPGHGPAQALADDERAVVILESLVTALGEDCPPQWRNDLAMAYMNWGNAKLAAPGYGPVQALADYDRAIGIRESLVAALGEGCPPEWRDALATTYSNRGNAKQAAPGFGPVEALADYDRAVAIRESLVAALGEDCPPEWRDGLATAYMNRGVAKQAAPGYGPVQALADYDRAVGILESLVSALGKDCPPGWRNNLAGAYVNRGNAKQAAPGYGPVQALADYDRAVGILESLVSALGKDCPPGWRNNLAGAYVNRGNAKQAAPGYGPVQALADYDRAVGILESLVSALGKGCPPEWRDALAKAYANRGVAKRAAPGYGPVQALTDYDRAVEIRESLVSAMGEGCPPERRNELAATYRRRASVHYDQGTLDEARSDLKKAKALARGGSTPKWLMPMPGVEDFDWIEWSRAQTSHPVELDTQPLDALCEACPRIRGLSGTVRVTGSRPHCLKGAALVEVRQMTEEGTDRLLRMVVTPSFLVHLDGTSEPLHGLVAEGVVATEDAHAAKDWMRLFCENLGNQEVTFSIAETDDEMLWTAGASVDERTQVVAHLRPFLVEKDSSGRCQGTACMLYGSSLVRVTLDLLGTQVRMLDDEVLLEKLPVRRRRHQDGWIVIEPPGSQFESQE